MSDDATPKTVVDDGSSTVLCGACGQILRLPRSADGVVRLAIIAQHRAVCPARRP
jgi:hypothetical protein